ncbi:MAG: hypothetical protein H0U69_03465 [Trueperaceae bacterium]|nr:hypothetical protein [Trueperaceae bacterium]
MPETATTPEPILIRRLFHPYGTSPPVWQVFRWQGSHVVNLGKWTTEAKALTAKRAIEKQEAADA